MRSRAVARARPLSRSRTACPSGLSAPVTPPTGWCARPQWPRVDLPRGLSPDSSRTPACRRRWWPGEAEAGVATYPGDPRSSPCRRRPGTNGGARSRSRSGTAHDEVAAADEHRVVAHDPVRGLAHGVQVEQPPRSLRAVSTSSTIAFCWRSAGSASRPPGSAIGREPSTLDEAGVDEVLAERLVRRGVVERDRCPSRRRPPARVRRGPIVEPVELAVPRSDHAECGGAAQQDRRAGCCAWRGGSCSATPVRAPAAARGRAGLRPAPPRRAVARRRRAAPRRLVRVARARPRPRQVGDHEHDRRSATTSARNRRFSRVRAARRSPPHQAARLSSERPLAAR